MLQNKIKADYHEQDAIHDNQLFIYIDIRYVFMPWLLRPSRSAGLSCSARRYEAAWVGSGLLDGVKRDEASQPHEGAERHDVRKERLADFLDGELRDGDAHDMREIGDVWHELFIKDEQAVGIEILIVLVRRFLRHASTRSGTMTCG